MNLLPSGRDKKVSAFWRRKIWCGGIKKHALSGPGEKWIEEDRWDRKIDFASHHVSGTALSTVPF